MKLIALILGILINLRCVLSITGVIDISDPKSRELFSGPTKIGNAQFYKFTCKDNGSYSNVFDKNHQIFPLRSHTRLVNIVLACRDENVELVQVMYSDVKKDLRLNNLYYKKTEESWELIDLATYKSELFNLKNNYVSFQLNDEENVGFKRVKSEKEDGYDSYVLEEEYEIDKIYENKLVVWESDPNYTFKSLDLAKTEYGQEQLRIRFSNYCSEVSQYYKIAGGRWILEIGKRVVDLRSLYTHGVERNEVKEEDDDEESEYDYMSSMLEENDENNEFEEESVTVLASDLCDFEKGSVDIQFNMNFTKGKNHEFTVRYYTTFEILNYEFLSLKGARVNSITDGDWLILDRVEDDQAFYNAKLSYVPNHDVATVAITSLKPMKAPFDSSAQKCMNLPYGLRHFFHKKHGAQWFCLEQYPYFYEMNNLMEVASHLTLKRMYESPPQTPTHTPQVMYLDYGGDTPFTYEINNPFENRITQEVLHTEPDFIRLRPKKGNVMNAIIDGSSVLWEQKESGKGVLMIYVYKSEENLIGHLVVDSKTEPHLFMKQLNGRWHLIDKEEYESLKDVPLEPKKVGFLKKKTTNLVYVDEYSLDPDAKPPPETEDAAVEQPESPESSEQKAEGTPESDETNALETEQTYNTFNVNYEEQTFDAFETVDKFGTPATFETLETKHTVDTGYSVHNHGNHGYASAHVSHYDFDHSPEASRNRLHDNPHHEELEVLSEDEAVGPKPPRPVKIKKSSMQFSQTPRSMTIELSEESEYDDMPEKAKTFDLDEL